MKKIYKFLTVFLSLFLIASPALLTVSASTGHVFTVPMCRPATGDRQGYAEIMFVNPTDGKTGVVVVAWSINQPYLGFDVGESVDFDRNITSYVSVSAYNSEVRFYPEITPYDYTAYMDWVAVYSNTYHSSGSLEFGEDVDGIAYVTFASGYKIFSVKVYGNARLDKNYSSAYTDFSVLYSDTATIYNELLKASASLREISASNTKIQNDVSSILNYTGSIDSKLTQLNNMIYNAIGDMSSDIQANADKNASQIQANQDKNTDKVINAGENVAQPGFDSTNGAVDNTTSTMQSIEGQYQIDSTATQSALSQGTTFLGGSDMQRASIQVKTWIERFSTENKIITGFLISAMVLGLCFWVIGRKSFR